MSWNLILCLWLLRIWFIFVLSLAQKYSKKRQGIRGGSRAISFRRQWVNIPPYFLLILVGASWKLIEN